MINPEDFDSKSIREVLTFHEMNYVNEDVGIEIEVELDHPLCFMDGMDYDDNFVVDKRWSAMHDGSLKMNGCEFVSSPLKYGSVGSAIKDLVKSVEAETSYDLLKIIHLSARASTHIHMNFQKETLKDLFKFLAVYYPLENLITKSCGSSREGNFFCLRMSDANGIVEMLNSCLIHPVTFNPENKAKFMLGNMRRPDMRYAALNLQSLFTFGTLEFRALQTPKDLHQINAWIHLLKRLKDKSKTLNSLLDPTHEISGLGPIAWAVKMLGEEFVELNHYHGLEKAIMKNVRDMQIFNNTLHRIMK